MYKILTITDDVRVEPVKFDRTPEQGVKESLQETIEGKLNPEAGVFLAVIEVLNIGDGKIIPEDGSIYYPSEFKVLVFRPEQNDITLGEVVDITEFGAFTRIGPMDALVHVSQIMDDKMAYDAKNATFTGKKTGKKLQEGEIVRARPIDDEHFVIYEDDQFKKAFKEAGEYLEIKRGEEEEIAEVLTEPYLLERALPDIHKVVDGAEHGVVGGERIEGGVIACRLEQHHTGSEHRRFCRPEHDCFSLEFVVRAEIEDADEPSKDEEIAERGGNQGEQDAGGEDCRKFVSLRDEREDAGEEQPIQDEQPSVEVFSKDEAGVRLEDAPKKFRLLEQEHDASYVGK